MVRRRLKLAKLSPRLLADYRASKVTLEQLMALAVTDDHARQEHAFYDAPPWANSADDLRERVIDGEIDAATDPLARFVGIEAYHAAGGVSRSDLFAGDGSSVLLGDRALLDRLALDKLAPDVERLKADGWQWVTPLPRATHYDLGAFRRLPAGRREPTTKQAKRIQQLRDEQAAIEADYDRDDGDVDHGALEQRPEAIDDELEAIAASLMHFSDEDRARSGVVLALDRQGVIVLHRGLTWEAATRADRATAVGPGHDDAAEPTAPPSLSEALARRLSAHRAAALQIELARRPDVALAALVHALVNQLVRHEYWSGTIDIRPHAHDRLDSFAPDIVESPAAVELRRMVETARAGLPEDGDTRWAALLTRPEADLLAMLALCVALTVNAVTPKPDTVPAGELAQALGLDMTRWWSPTAASYFGAVPKARIAEAVQAFAPGEVPRLLKLKKDAMAAEAERLATGTGWLPEPLRAANLSV